MQRLSRDLKLIYMVYPRMWTRSVQRMRSYTTYTYNYVYINIRIYTYLPLFPWDFYHIARTQGVYKKTSWDLWAEYISFSKSKYVVVKEMSLSFGFSLFCINSITCSVYVQRIPNGLVATV